MEQQELVVACARAAVRWLKRSPEHHHADRHRKAWAAAKTLNTAEDACVVIVSCAGFSLRRGADAPAVIPLARITRWGHDASDFFVETAAADASAVTNRTDGVIRIVVATRDGARLASMLRNHAIRALRAIDAAAAAARPRVNRRRSAVDEALIAAGSPLKSPARDGRVAIVQAVWRGARLRLAWRREESALVLQGLWRGYARQFTRRE